MKRWFGAGLAGAALIWAALYLAWTIPGPDSPVTADRPDAVTLMNFAPPFSLSPLPPGWLHRTFWFRRPMQMRLTRVDGHDALECDTDAGGSILMRSADIDIRRFSRLSWFWRVDQPVSSPLDETTPAGDDHPLRFFLAFADAGGGKHAAEIIWANRAYKRGDWKVIDGFTHYVADGGPEAPLATWRAETADLAAIYRRATGRNDAARLTGIGIMCDSDDTGGQTRAYVGGPVVLNP